MAVSIKALLPKLSTADDFRMFGVNFNMFKSEPRLFELPEDIAHDFEQCWYVFPDVEQTYAALEQPGVMHCTPVCLGTSTEDGGCV